MRGLIVKRVVGDAFFFEVMLPVAQSGGGSREVECPSTRRTVWSRSKRPELRGDCADGESALAGPEVLDRAASSVFTGRVDCFA